MIITCQFEFKILDNNGTPFFGQSVMCRMCKPMCASARVVSSNIVYLSTDIDSRGEVC